jgi:hypothetical protein
VASRGESETQLWESSFRVTLLNHLATIVKYAAKHLHLPCAHLEIDSEESEERVRSLSSQLLAYSLESDNPTLCETLAEVSLSLSLSLSHAL